MTDIHRPTALVNYLLEREARWLKRFWGYVHKSDPDKCWLWKGGCDDFGYGRICLGRVAPRAHRLSYELAYGPITDPALIVRHTCDVPPCVNPSHLILGTKLDNARDRDAKGRGGTTGIKNRNAKLTEDQVREIRRRYTGKYGHASQLMREFGIKAPSFYAIIRRANWKHVV